MDIIGSLRLGKGRPTRCKLCGHRHGRQTVWGYNTFYITHANTHTHTHKYKHIYSFRHITFAFYQFYTYVGFLLYAGLDKYEIMINVEQKIRNKVCGIILTKMVNTTPVKWIKTRYLAKLKRYWKGNYSLQHFFCIRTSKTFQLKIITEDTGCGIAKYCNWLKSYSWKSIPMGKETALFKISNPFHNS